jgi:hypothetical protein
MRFVAGVRPLDPLLRSLRGCLDGFPDKRRGINTTYGMGDIGMAAFSVFFMQSPSFLAHQRQCEEGHGRSNCTSLFGIGKIPSDNHIRDMLDRPRRSCCIRSSLKPSIKSGTSMAVWTCSAGSAGTC